MRLWPKWYRPVKRHSVARIVEAVCERSGITPEQVKGPRRSHDVILARFAVCYLAHKQGYSYPFIGRRLGGRDHSTIRAAVEKARVYREYDPEFSEMLADAAVQVLV